MEIRRVYEENLFVCDADKIRAQLNREDIAVGRGRVERLMRQEGFSGARRGKAFKVTTTSDDRLHRPADLVAHEFKAPAPADLSALAHHSDRGLQYLSIRYSERLADNAIVASVGSKGDSHDNALAESFNGLYKWELIYQQGPCAAWTTAATRPRQSSKPSTTVRAGRPSRPPPTPEQSSDPGRFTLRWTRRCE